MKKSNGKYYCTKCRKWKLKNEFNEQKIVMEGGICKNCQGVITERIVIKSKEV